VLKTLLPIDNDAMMMMMLLLTDDEFHVSYDASNDNNKNDRHNM
jgi:hypothetical protein